MTATDRLGTASPDQDPGASSVPAPGSTIGEVVRVELDKIGGDQGIRSDRLDLDHVALMRHALDSLPPVVLRPHARPGHYEAIDGSHRIQAHRDEGRAVIDAVVLDLDDAAAIELGTRANITHGRPLSRADRRRNAERLIAAAPDWSNVRIAAACGLSDKTVSELRPAAQPRNSEVGQSKTTGADGRKRPATKADAEQARADAARVAVEDPDISDRDLAERTGVSKGTAANVKRDVRDGKTRGHLRDVSATDEDRDAPPSVADLGPIIPQSWSRHPAAKASNDARDFCAWIDRRCIRRTGSTDAPDIVATYAAKVPGQLIEEAEAAARIQAGLWLDFAAAVNRRRRQEALK